MRHLRGLRDDRQPQPVRDGGPEDGAVGVVRLLAEQDQIGALALERLRERRAGGDEIGAGRPLVGDEHRAVGTHREGLAQGVLRLRRAERDEDDLALAAGVLQTEGLLDRVGVKRVERPLAGAVEPLGLGDRGGDCPRGLA